MDLLSQCPLYSTELGTKGFDISAGNKWIYPENYPIREYQFTIVRTALFHNTLVCLPTGLGKTFIAAVVMYNFWRWYPTGIIVFLAPTKPLVAQQIDACHDIMGIPFSQIIELTGAINQKQREIAWVNRRVIFATPQTFQKDLEKGIVNTEFIKCVVIDEAHKALGKHAYCESIRLLQENNQYYRVLALSATPGSKLDAVQEVIRNLHITHLELRDDTSPDITPYINERKLEIVQVGFGNDLIHFHERYIKIMDPHFRMLLKNNVIRGVTTNISKGRIFHIRKEFMGKPQKPYNYGDIMKTLNILLSMCHANDLLINHGLRAFMHFYQNHAEKFWLKNEPDLIVLLNEINDFMGPFPKIQSLMDGTIEKIPDDIKFGHEKFYKLRELLMKHFESAAEKNIDTRAIVFIEFRDIVNEVFVLLLQLKPLIRPQIFVGQVGLKQKQQKKALDDFRNNHVNVLISTSVGEEGLDVGEVDLIICFDILQQSPTRLVQRMGRTGRKRNGHIIVLVTDNREYKTLKSALAKKDALNHKVLHSSGIISALGNQSPRMIPKNLNPECLKMRITAIPTTPRSKKLRNKIESKVLKVKDNVKYNERKITKKIKSVIDEKKHSSTKGQSTMMKFLEAKLKNSQDSEFVNMKIETVHPIQSKLQLQKYNLEWIKPSDAKLLTIGNESIEFLTLCTLNQSEKDSKTEKEFIDFTYMPHILFDDSDPFCNFEIPSLKILDCIETLKKYVISSPEKLDDLFEGDNVEIWAPNNFSHSADNISCDDSILTHGRFEDLLDNSSDSDSTIFSGDDLSINQQINSEINKENITSNEEKKNNNIVLKRNSVETIIVGGPFEDLLDDTTDESNQETSKLSQLYEPVDDNLLKTQENIIDMKMSLREVETRPIYNLLTLENVITVSDKNMTDGKILLQHQMGIVKRKVKEHINNDDENSIVQVDSIQNIDYIDDFSLWDGGKNSHMDLIESYENERTCLTDVIIRNGKAYETLCNEKQIIDASINENLRSPDLSKSINKKKSKLNMPMNLSAQTSITVASERSTFTDVHHIDDDDDDDDVLGVESLLVDSDNEEKLAEKEYNIEKNLQKNFTNADNLIDNFDCNSDFETLSVPITESKYFKSRSNQNFFNLISNQSPNTSQKFHNISQKSPEFHLGIQYKENKCFQSTADKKSQSIHDDFASKKKNDLKSNLYSNNVLILNNPKKAVERELENDLLDYKIFSNSPEKLPESTTMNFSSHYNRPKSPAVKCFKEFVMSEKFTGKPKVSLKTEPSTKCLEKKRKCTENRTKNKNIFIDDKAEVSKNEETYSSDNSDGDEEDDLGDFVSYSQYHDTCDMKAHYLQTIRSPMQVGQFLIKKPSHLPPDTEVYSQEIVDEPNTYLHDSFCVDENEEILEQSDCSSTEVSVLTILDQKLEKRKRKRMNYRTGSRTKRKRITVNIYDDSSEDETEKLRLEIADESMMLKKK